MREIRREIRFALATMAESMPEELCLLLGFSRGALEIRRSRERHMPAFPFSIGLSYRSWWGNIPDLPYTGREVSVLAAFLKQLVPKEKKRKRKNQKEVHSMY